MPSNASNIWQTTRSAELDLIEAAHSAVEGTAPGRRYATQQINQAYAVLLSSHFQGFCRDLHSECCDFLVSSVASAHLHRVLFQSLTLARQLDRGNPNPGNVGSDFNRLGLQFWPRVTAMNARNAHRRDLLEEMNRWRNAVAHQDFDPAVLGGRTSLQLRQVLKWRQVCNALTKAFDDVLNQYLQNTVGAAPW